MTVPADVAALAFIDERSTDIAADVGVVWDAVVDSVRGSADSAATRIGARLLGCDPATGSVGAGGGLPETVPGFRVAAAGAPRLVVLSGQHRFAAYAIVLRIDPTESGARCRLESRADFPG